MNGPSKTNRIRAGALLCCHCCVMLPALNSSAVIADWRSLYHFPTNSYPQATLVFGSDGALYVRTHWGGDYGRGTIFRLDPTSTLYPPSRVANGWQLFFAGLPENTYRVQRSSSAAGPWSTVANAKAGDYGAGSWIDATLNLERAFYRLVYP